MPLINCEINLIVTWSADCVIHEADRRATFAIPDKKRCLSVITL